MNRTTKNAPFGTDNTPILEYKIVGGKRVEVLAQVDSSQHKNEYRGNVNHHGPHGTPSMSTQPMFRDYEYADLLQGYNTAKQHEVARKISSYTSPFGDRTQSFRHGKQIINKHPILPPIGKSQPSGNDFVHEIALKEDFQSISAPKVVSNSSLEATVAQSLRGYNSRKIKDMYVELSGFDRKLTGFVSEPQLSLITLRHNLPLKLSTMKLLFRQFSDTKNPNEINYEKFLQFLSSCMSNPHPLEISAAKSQDSIRSFTTVPNPNDVGSLTTSELNGNSESYSVDEKLVVMLKEQLIDCDDFDCGKLRQALLNADANRLGNGELQADVILQACVNARLPLTSSILTHMLQQAEIAHGNVSWRQFLAPLECACKQLNLNITMHDESRIDPHKSNPASATAFSKSSQHRDTAKGQRSTATMGNDEQDLSSSRKVSLRDQLSAGWDERQPFGSKEPLSSAEMITSEEGRDSSPRRTESWLRNFTRLAHALRSYHPFKSGEERRIAVTDDTAKKSSVIKSVIDENATDVLPRAEVERMVNNYNLIYGLGFSPARISNAVEQAVASKAGNEDQACVSIDLLLNNLSGMSRKD